MSLSPFCVSSTLLNGPTRDLEKQTMFSGFSEFAELLASLRACHFDLS